MLLYHQRSLEESLNLSCVDVPEKPIWNMPTHIPKCIPYKTETNHTPRKGKIRLNMHLCSLAEQ